MRPALLPYLVAQELGIHLCADPNVVPDRNGGNRDGVRECGRQLIRLHMTFVHALYAAAVPHACCRAACTMALNIVRVASARLRLRGLRRTAILRLPQPQSHTSERTAPLRAALASCCCCCCVPLICWMPRPACRSAGTFRSPALLLQAPARSACPGQPQAAGTARDPSPAATTRPAIRRVPTACCGQL